jgi:hypothetical protein
VAYRESPDALRERIEQVERELHHARAEGARIPALTQELADLRAKLRGDRPARRRPILLGGAAVLLLVAGGVLLATKRRVTVPEARRGSPASISAPHPAHRLLPADVRACVARLPRAPDFHVITDFEHAAGDLRVTWRLTPASSPHSDRPSKIQRAFGVRLDLEAGAIAHGEQLGVHAGHPYSRELSICRSAPAGSGPCSGTERAPEMPGVLSELTVQDWEAYVHHSSMFWMLVRTPSSALLLRTKPDVRMGRLLDDRLLCEPGAWEVAREILLGTTLGVSEQVLLGDPPVPLDCIAWDERDWRCTG